MKTFSFLSNAAPRLAAFFRRGAQAALPGLLLLASSSGASAQLTNSYRLVFAEEFNGTSVDGNKWVVASPSWTMPNSNSTASASQVSVANGVLTLNATRLSSGASFSSGSVSTYGKYNLVGGYVEASIKLPTTVGSWPAFWGLYTGWPPEADIMEYPLTTDGGKSGYASNIYSTNYHYTNSSGAAAAGAGSVSTGSNLGGTWHIFAMDWSAGTSVKFFLDGKQVTSYTGSTVAQMANMYMILDYAVGGWPGTPSTTQWPVGWNDQTLVDWVRVWQKNANGDTTSVWSNANGSGTFSTASNWGNGIAPSFGNQTASFGTVGSAATATISMPTWVVFGNVLFNGATAYTLGNSANSIQLAGQPLGSTTNGSTVQATAASTVSQNINAKVELWSAVTAENDMTGGQTLNFNGAVSGNGALNVTGVGTTAINATSIFTGGANIGVAQEGAVLRANANSALGGGTVVIGTSGNATTARLELNGNFIQGNPIDFRGRNNASVGIENIGGNHALGGVISATAGGGAYLIQSDAGTLTLDGALQAANGARTFTLQGAGNGVVNGAIQNGVGVVSLVKAGAGVWTLTGANTYAGSTTVNEGTLRLGTLAPVAAYTFDSVNGATVANTGGGGSAMDGVLVGGATVVSGGRFGNALSLSGGAYLNINNPVMDLGNYGGWSVSAWVKTTTAGATILSKGSGTSWTTGNTIFYLGDGVGGGSGGVPSGVRYAGGFFQGAATAKAVNDGAWHLVTYVNNGGLYAIYVDGAVQTLSVGNSSFGNADVGSVIRLGFTSNNNAGDGTVNFNGLLDEVQFFNQPLSTAQVAALYQGQPLAGSLPAATSLVLGSNGNVEINGVDQTLASVGGGGTLTKNGGGTLTLSGANSFTGATVLNGGTLSVSGSLPAGGTLTTAAGTLLTGGGAVNANAAINGTHQPGATFGTQNFASIAYGGTARLAWALGGNSDTTNFDQVAASGAVQVNNGAVIDVLLNAAGGAVDLSNAFWTQAHTWPVLTAGSLAGDAFALGTVSADPAGRSVANYGTLALQQSGSGVSLVFTPYTALQNWQRRYFGADWNNPAVAGNLADSDNDGVVNLVEFALGLDPTNPADAVPCTASAPGLPAETVLNVGGQNYLALTVRRPIGLTGITYAAKVSGDMATWTDAVQEGAAAPNGDGTETVVFRDPTPMNQSGKRFIRLQITQ